MKRAIRHLLAVSLTLSAIAVACGGAKYPNCDSDTDCNADGHHGVCLDGKCVACRDNTGCGSGQTCDHGECATPAPKATASAQVVHDPTACDDDHPCTNPGEHCQNGHCVAPPHGGPGCQDFPAPKFAYESPELTEDAKKTVQRLAACLTTGSLKGAHVLLVGHCDARGEYEFNMGLGAERAEGAKKLLMSFGVPADIINTTSRGKLDASGSDEAGWANDRRVDIEIR